MAQIGATRDESHPRLRGHRLEATQGHSKTLILGVAWLFSNVEVVDKQRLAYVCRVAFAIYPSVMHQHMKAIHASR